MILGLNPHAFENLPAAEQKRLVAEHGSEKAARAALVERYGEMAEHPIVKMSKSLGNVINPDDVIAEYGADTLRLYEMFIGDFEKAAPWSTAGVRGCRRFLDRVWGLQDSLLPGDGVRKELELSVHRTIRKVSEDTETLKYNTAIAALMSLLNDLTNAGGATREEFRIFLILLNPFAPHITEELWQLSGFGGQIAHAQWPAYDPAKCVEQTVEIVVQVGGKIRGRIRIPVDAAQADVLAQAKTEEKVAAELAGKTIVRELYVPGKLVNFVVKP